MKALFRPFALHAAYTPIETIVFFSVVGTLAYFHILNAIKHSAFLDPGRTGNVYSPPVMRPAHVLFKLGEWVGVRESTWLQSAGGAAVELQQVIFTIDGAKMKGSEVCHSLLSLTCSEPCPRYQTSFR
jgi:hydroxymethylglutaryl-CoA reductase (NADPH)